jgi:deoxyribodipyrimidine photolyase-related protein
MNVKLIFPHQLFEQNPLLPILGETYLVEEFLFFKQYNFHKQKIAFHRASMKFYADYLLQNGEKLQYIEAQAEIADVRKLIPFLHQKGVKCIYMVEPVDDWLSKRVKNACQMLNMEWVVLDSPMFLNTQQSLSVFFSPTKKKFFQTAFYKEQRIQHQVLITQSGEPTGGQWTFDTENRKKYPKGKPLTKVDFPKVDAYTSEARTYTNTYFGDNIGSLGNEITYPIGFEESIKWLKQFLTLRMHEFGDYEDAIVYKATLLNHSLLTPMLNVGMLSPKQILAITMEHHLANEVPINSLEGFIRQILGWREFIRGVYISKGSEERTDNFWKFERKMPKCFYNATTGILPVDETIKKVLKSAYCHHIERLMVLGNFMLLCEINPNEVYQWFMEFFIDAYDWVMVPNVYGMSQFADGGLMSTKPYISGSNYLMKMSDYPKGEWEEIWDALFWRFLDIHRAFFLKNPRLSMLVKTFDKWDAAKKSHLHLIATTYLEKLDKS